jgi:ParD-like antitoxin of type II bacterial toxin-antitoxin system
MVLSATATPCGDRPPERPAVPAATFNSVKLPAPLVEEARHTALIFRRSTAAQIEYWALLGKAVEESGITVREARAAMAPGDERAGDAAGDQAQSLLDGYVALDQSGGLARHVRNAVAANARKAAGAAHAGQPAAKPRRAQPPQRLAA